MMGGSPGQLTLLFSLAFLALAAAAVTLALQGSATLTPPASGDWVIDAGENAALEGLLTVVVGNITVRGTLYAGNGTLELDPPLAGVVPRLVVEGPATLTVVNSTITAGPGPSNRFLLDSTAGARVTGVRADFEQLGTGVSGNLTDVGMRLIGTVLQLTDSFVNRFTDTHVLLPLGGIGLADGSSLTASGLSLQVNRRGIFLTGLSTATLSRSNLSGNAALTDFLVLVDRSGLTFSDGSPPARFERDAHQLRPGPRQWDGRAPARLEPHHAGRHRGAL
jgi:hypothetical protein